jgi:hypothetical protein
MQRFRWSCEEGLGFQPRRVARYDLGVVTKTERHSLAGSIRPEIHPSEFRCPPKLVPMTQSAVAAD